MPAFPFRERTPSIPPAQTVLAGNPIVAKSRAFQRLRLATSQEAADSLKQHASALQHRHSRESGNPTRDLPAWSDCIPTPRIFLSKPCRLIYIDPE